MNISPVKTCLYQNINSNVSTPKREENKRNEYSHINKNQISSEAIKAKYLPSFGLKHKKIRDITLIDRETGEPVKASLRKNEIGGYKSLKIFVNGKEAGYLDMCLDSYFPPDEIYSCKLPEVQYFRSIMGDKYKGIGTNLINAAIEESYKAGNRGELYVFAVRGFAKKLSPYRSDENPIPFYYKMGFKAFNKDEDNLIKYCLENSDYEKLPYSAMLILTQDQINTKNKYLASNYIFKND